MDKAFTIDGAIQFAWSKVKAQLGFFIGFTVLIIVLEVINGFVQSSFEDAGLGIFFFIYLIIGIVIGVIVGLWQIRIALDVTDGNKATFESIQKVIPLIGKALITQILYGVIVVIGFFLLIIPGFIWAIKYQFAIYFIVDKNMSPFEALEASGKITKGEKWHLFFFGLALGIVVLVGLILLGIGLLVAVPVAIVAPAYVFRQLQKHAQGGSSSGKESTETPAAV